MDFWGIIVVCVIALIIFSMCSWCCKKSKAGGNIYPPVSVETASGPVQTPYPPTQTGMPMPSTYNVGAAPYPTHVGVSPTPYPVGFNPGVVHHTPAFNAPYPPNVSGAPYPIVPPGAIPAPGELPPSYSQAVLQPPVTEVLVKQPPYNPHF